MKKEISVEMASGNMSESGRLEREQKRLEINVNIGRPEGLPTNGWNTRRLQTRAIPVTHWEVPPRSSSVALERLDRVDKLVHYEKSSLEVMNLIRNQAYTKKHVSFELDTVQGEGITQK